MLVFPPGKTGGLIEALPPLRIRPAPPGFPPGKTGGLIEAFIQTARTTTRRRRFPPGKTGGLIEASVRSTTLPPVPRFRRVKPAASLKPRLGVASSAAPFVVSAG